jgi:hypothetical protein
MNLKLSSGWSYCTDQILQFENDLPKGDRLVILELGAGDSSVKLYEYFKEKYNDIDYTCYETDKRWLPNNKNIISVLYSDVKSASLPNKICDLVLVDGPTGVTRKFWYEKLNSVVKPGTIVHIDDYDHYSDFEEELNRNLNFSELYRKSRKVKGEKSWLTVRIEKN